MQLVEERCCSFVCRVSVSAHSLFLLAVTTCLSRQDSSATMPWKLRRSIVSCRCVDVLFSARLRVSLIVEVVVVRFCYAHAFGVSFNNSSVSTSLVFCIDTVLSSPPSFLRSCTLCRGAGGGREDARQGVRFLLCAVECCVFHAQRIFHPS